MAAQAIWASEGHVVNHNASFQIEDATSANVALHSDERYGIGLPRIVGNSDALRRVLGMVRVVAPTDATVLIGETADQGIENQQAPIQFGVGVSRAPISGIRGIHGLRVIHGMGTAVHRRFYLFSITCKWQEPCFLPDRSRHGTTRSLQQEGEQ